MDRQELVLSSLAKFLKVHVPHSSISGIDDIVLHYLVGILEEVGNEDGFDAEDFKEMMEGYIPDFGDIESVAICEWIFQLSEEVLTPAACEKAESAHPPSDKSNAVSCQDESSSCLEDIDLPYLQPVPDNSNHGSIRSTQRDRKHEERIHKSYQKSNSVPSSRDGVKLLVEMFPDSCKVTVRRCLSDSNGDVEKAIQALLLSQDGTPGGPLRTASNKSSTRETEASEENIKLLLEMFPASTELQARQCLSIANGNLEHASQVLLDMQESGPCEERGLAAMWSTRKAQVTDDTNVKSSLLQKYGYVDTDDDRKDHRPVGPKKEQKKMVRYINSQKVTTKGERFVETKKTESEEMKKTYTNLKPARKYHSH